MARLLVVDDKADQRYLLRSLLQPRGHEVVEAENGRKALNLAREQPPHLLITDILMPEMDGYTLCREWMRDAALQRIPVVIHTATYTEPADEALARSLGARRFIAKPVEPAELLAQIEAELQRGAIVPRSATPVEAGRPNGEERDYLRQYSARLVRKLEQKSEELVGTNARLEFTSSHLSAILDASDAAIVSIDREGRIVGWNTAAQNLFGYTKQEVLGRSRELLMPAEMQEEGRAQIRAAQESDGPVRFESVRMSKEGRRVEVEMSLANLGNDLGTVGMFRDLSARRELEAKVESSEQRLERVIAASPTVFYSLALREGQPTPVWVSENLEELLGYRPDEAATHAWWVDHLHPDDREQAQQAVQQLMRDGEVTHEYRFRHADGRTVTILDKLRLVRDAAGEAHEAIGAWMDVTALREIEAEKDRLERQYLQAQKMEAIGTLAGGIAHDFNNLLSIIISFSELIKGAVPEQERVHQDILHVISAALRSADLTRQLLAFSRKQVVQPRRIDLAEQVRNLSKMLTRLIGEDIILETDLPEHLPAVLMDPGSFDQVVMNLVVNARDAMPKGGTLELALRQRPVSGPAVADAEVAAPGQHVELRVRDSGCGMDKETLARVFEPFFTTKGLGKGTGLGLSTVYGIVAQAGGTIEAESRPQRGSTFSVLLPALGADVEEAAADPAGGVADLHGSETILVVDDDPEIREVLRRVLGPGGYEILLAANSREALDVIEARKGRIQLLLTDIVMPHMSGIALAETVVRSFPHTRILCMTGYFDDKVDLRTLERYRWPLMRKPFTPGEVLTQVRGVLDRPPAR